MASWAETNSGDKRGETRVGTPLYLHLPFCRSKCHYCDFFSVPDAGQDIAGTVDAVLSEIERRAPQSPTTVFFGGGTPSLLDVPSWTRLLEALQAKTDFRTSATEVTAECNPESLDVEKARALRDLGVPRLSIGFQSLRDDMLQLFGRVHTVEESFRAYDAARQGGAGRVNIDLLYGLPDQQPEAWAKELRRVLELGPDSLSAYNLTYEEGTVFERWRSEGRLARRPEEVELEMFHTTRSLTAEFGYEAYEISNFAKPGAACEHNRNYWRNGEYVGIGPSAVSKIGWTRSGNRRGIGPYRKAVESAEDPLDWSETLEAPHRLAETWWLGLRTPEGIHPEEARTRSGFPEDAHDLAEELAEKQAAQGFLERKPDGAWALSATGLPLADALATQYLERAIETAEAPQE